MDVELKEGRKRTYIMSKGYLDVDLR